jgi:hypothetical protein
MGMSRDSARTPVEAEPGVLVHTPADRQLATEHWLLSTHPTPRQAQKGWARDGIALLPLGTLFSAVRIPARLVHAAAGSDDHAAVDAYLADALHGGPVICDPRGRHYYALVPASTAARWRHPLVECLGRDTYLGVPRLDAVGLDAHAWASYWSVPMSSLADLCSPEAVSQLVVLGSFRAAEEGPE